MTDKVIEELQSASKWFAEHGKNTNTAVIGICDRAVDEINRQRAEIERLEIELKVMRETANSLKMHYDLAVAEREANVKGFTESIATVKAEAVKEFADALVQELLPSGMVLIERYSINAKAVRLAIYNIEKEMVGEQK